MNEPGRTAASPCIVTGATGYVGRALVAALLGRGRPVVALVRDEERARSLLALPGLAFFEVDLLDPDLEEQLRGADLLSRADTIFHLAASLDYFGNEVQEALNVRATGQLLAAAEASGIRRFVYASSIEATGMAKRGTARDEGDLGLHSPYGASKLEGERILERIADRTRVVAARIGIVFGPGDRWTTSLARMLGSGDERCRFFPLLRDVCLDLVHIDEVVEYVQALEDVDRRFVSFHVSAGPTDFGNVIAVVSRALRLELPDACPVELEAELSKRVRLSFESGQADLLAYLAWPDRESASRQLSHDALEASLGRRPRRRFSPGEVRRILSP